MKIFHLKLLISIAAGIVIMLVTAGALGGFSPNSTLDGLKHWCDAAFCSAVILGCVGLLFLSANGGTFDILIYGTKKFFSAFVPASRRKKQTFLEYREEKSEKKISFAHLLIGGGFFLVVAVALLIAYFSI